MTNRSHIFYMGEPCSESEFEMFIDEVKKQSFYDIILLPHCDSSEMNAMISEARFIAKELEFDQEFWTDDRIMSAIVAQIKNSKNELTHYKLPKSCEFNEQVIKNADFYKQFEKDNHKNHSFWYVSDNVQICIDKLSATMKYKLTEDNELLPFCFNNYLMKPDFLTSLSLLNELRVFNKNYSNEEPHYYSPKVIITAKHFRQFLVKLNEKYIQDFNHNDLAIARHIVNNCLILVNNENTTFNWMSYGEYPEDIYLLYKPNEYCKQLYEHYFCPVTFRHKRNNLYRSALNNVNVGELKYLFIKQMISNFHAYYFKNRYNSFGRYTMNNPTPKIIINAMNYILLYRDLFCIDNDYIENDFFKCLNNALDINCINESHLEFINHFFVRPFLNWDGYNTKKHTSVPCPFSIDNIANMIEKWLTNNNYQNNLDYVYNEEPLNQLLNYTEFNSMLNKLKLKVDFVEDDE
ncbi:hypothetical protein PBI_SCTP2_516 [Salicola phage SCTP-2]|nr:hypothetical protein PBI_SCTP2_516 [Salicola phage SCTP-2]